MASAQPFYGISQAGLLNPNGYFSFFGIGLTQRNISNPQYNVVEAKALTPAGVNFTAAFYHSGPQLDIIWYGSGSGFDLYIDDVYVDHFSPPINAASSGTLATNQAQAGGASTITLAANESATNGRFNTTTIRIVSGTGAGQLNQITGYVGSTQVATVANAWLTQPDSTSVYVITDSAKGNYVDRLNGSLNYINLNWGSVATRKITMVTQGFTGVNIGPNDSLWPAPPYSGTRIIIVGDSFIAGTGGPFPVAIEATQLAYNLGWQGWYDGEGGTSWVNTNNGGQLNFMDRIAPPVESWAANFTGASSGTFTISVTYNGQTQTTAAIAYNATGSAVQTAIQALTILPANSVTVANGPGGVPTFNLPSFILLHKVPGANLTWNLSGVAGITASYLNRWTGTVAPMVPVDGTGDPVPFILYVQGSGNDSSPTTPAQVATNINYTAQQIALRFPTALTIFSGEITSQGTAVDAPTIAFNTALQAGAALLPLVNGQVPFIQTSPNVIGGSQWINGSGTVAAPTSSTNDVLKSIIITSHPTGAGHSFLASRVAQNIKQILGAK